MIYQSLRLLVSELNKYLDPIVPDDNDPVSLGNVALYDPPGQQGHGGGPGNNGGEKNILLSLVNLEEEKTLKNKPGYQKFNGELEFRNPPVYLNLYILFSVTTRNYENALIYLSHIIGFFQANRIFTNKNTPIPAVSPQIEDQEEFRMILNLYSPTFEESNYLWSTLGGKLYPSVLYKLRIVPVEMDHTLKAGKLINEIQGEDTLL